MMTNEYLKRMSKKELINLVLEMDKQRQNQARALAKMRLETTTNKEVANIKYLEQVKKLQEDVRHRDAMIRELKQEIITINKFKE
jgi:trehalose-6-phosphate synthase